jgi:hypothetical protein
MATFTTAQSLLSAARAGQDAAQLSASQAAARLRQAQEALDSATRQTSPQDDSGTIVKLADAVRRATEQLQAAQKALESTRAGVAGATAAFGKFTTPQQSVSLLSAGSPFLLFPVRIETRFRTSSSSAPPPGAVAAPAQQLLVRIYPDDCSIDTFEPMLSDSELANVKSYWMNIWRAGGIEKDQRGAWSGLVAAHGSGRAGWLIDTFHPVNLGAEPKKTAAADEVLVIPATAPLADPQAAAISTYWKSVWLADGDAAKTDAARATLDAAVGVATAADLIANYGPFNPGDRPAAPLTKDQVDLSVAFVIFPPDPATNLQTWSLAPQVRQFPDRFVVLGFNGSTRTLEAIGSPVTLPLYTGPDPSVDPKLHPEACIHPDGSGLFVPDQLQWMVDFDRAVAAGMALAIPLTAAQYAAGFTRLIALGLQLGTSEKQGGAALQELLAHHQASRSGLFVVPQGTPAHNSTGSNAGKTPDDDADASFDDRRNRSLFHVVSDPTEKQDGQWLAEFLGLDPNFIAGVHGCRGVDQMQARAMQMALWPATFGYWMDTMFTPTPGTASAFSDPVIAQTREFFTSFVSGRGPLPAIRIAGQPYGILPTTAFSRIQWFQGSNIPAPTALSQPFLGSLYGLLRNLDSDWTLMSQKAAWIGKPGDPHQTLLDILALHPSSVEYFSRDAESVVLLFNMLNRFALGPAWFSALSSHNVEADPAALLRRLGYTAANLPDLLNHLFLTDNPQIGTIIDDRALSEASPVRSYADNGRNYIQWLIDAATTSLDELREESGFTGNQTPQALLYLFLRHALLLGYYDASYNLHRDTGVLSGTALLAMRTEPTFVHVADAAGSSESRFAALYKTESRITGSTTLQVGDYIRQQLTTASATADLAAQIDALKVLVGASTAELERLFAEHVDTCSYRYDAWLLGLVNQRLATQREITDGEQQGAGLYLGAYSWVEDLHPSSDKLTPVELPKDLAAQFLGAAPLLSDANNGGYIHAPSMPHADAAAVLRAGFLAAQSAGGNTGELSVNLSSDRVRVALSLIEGIRTGQSLGALLGYQFELGLHDDYQLAEVDKFIYPLRKAFPLVADALASTKTDADTPIQAIEARNVLDGKKLVGQIANSGVTAYPWGVQGLPDANPDQQTALNGTADALRDSYDALADLALAEGVYQAVQGNYDRVASTISAYTTGAFPPEPAIVNAAPLGVGLTHRFAIQFRPGLPPRAGMTPRAQAEPALDDWLGGILPALDHIACTAAWTDPASGTAHQHTVTLADLGVRPLDTLYLLKPDNVQSMAELDDRIQRFIASTWNPRPDATVQIQYLVAPSGPHDFSMFETAPLLRNLRSLLLNSRALRASDVLRANDVGPQDDATVFVDQARLTAPLAELNSVAADLDAFVNDTLAPLLIDTTANRAQILANVDGFLAQTVELLERTARLALPSSGWGFVYDWLHAAFVDLMGAVAGVVTRWTQRLSDFQDALTPYDALPFNTPDPIRMAALNQIQLFVAAQLDPALPTPTLLRPALPGKAGALQTRLAQFQAIQASSGTSFASLLASITALPTAEFDSVPFDVSAIGDRAIVITQDISRVLTSQLSEARTRIDAVNGQLSAASSAGSPADRVKALTAAAKALLGDDFQIFPEFTVSAAQGGEWANAVNAANSGDPFTYLRNTLQIDFPVEEWFYGVARVRQQVRYWESALMLATAFRLNPPPLTPIQFPFEAGAPWLAMQFPDTYTIDSDRLLYTSLYSQPFDPNARQVGVLVDEWTEVIPATTRDTALSFNYARPDTEAPQTLLLVASPLASGSWQWDDLVAALNETLDLAKKRAVEPAFFDPTAYSRILPATVTASTTYAITIATTFTAANGAIEALQGDT